MHVVNVVDRIRKDWVVVLVMMLLYHHSTITNVISFSHVILIVMLIDLLLLPVFHITGVTVITGWGYNQLYYFIDYAVSSALWAVVPINITNTNRFSRVEVLANLAT